MKIIFKDIPDIKENNQQFQLLAQVNSLVIYQDPVLPQFLFPKNDKGKKRDRRNFRIFEKQLADNNHETKIKFYAIWI